MSFLTGWFDKGKEWLRNIGIRKFVGSTVRHVMAGLGAFLLGQGYTDAAAAAEHATGDVEIIATAIALVVIGYFTSLDEKAKRPATPEPVVKFVPFQK